MVSIVLSIQTISTRAILEGILWICPEEASVCAFVLGSLPLTEM